MLVKRDFTVGAYAGLVRALVGGYRMIPFREFLRDSGDVRLACLRHDVDRRPDNALRCAEVARDLGVRSTFYFRAHTFHKPTLRAVEAMGHEVGYQYETLARSRGDLAAAVRLFARELAELRGMVKVHTVCMHGSPLSRWDNRDIWSVTSLEEHGLEGEVYLSMRGARVAYATDTGRGWNQRSASMRDFAEGSLQPFPGTAALAKALTSGTLPSRLIVNVHPERWNDAAGPWLAQLMGQAVRNVAKRVLRRVREHAR